MHPVLFFLQGLALDDFIPTVFGKTKSIFRVLAGSIKRNMPEVVCVNCVDDVRVLAELPFCVSLSSKDQAEMDPADMEDVEEVEEEETGEDENSKGQSLFKDAPLLRV